MSPEEQQEQDVLDALRKLGKPVTVPAVQRFAKLGYHAAQRTLERLEARVLVVRRVVEGWSGNPVTVWEAVS